jgi:hypothetical protein
MCILPSAAPAVAPIPAASTCPAKLLEPEERQDLALLQFYFNHRRFDRSECPQRAGKSPAELLTGQTHPHWLALLGYQPFSQN